MTVAELINKLQAAVAARPELANAYVDTEGCDCVGPALDIEIDEPSRVADRPWHLITIKRDESIEARDARRVAFGLEPL